MNQDAKAQETNLTGKVAVVTGATSGMGEAIALRLAQAGARVVVHGRNSERGASVVQRIEALGSQALWIAGDVQAPETPNEMVQAASERWGRLDIVVANAGVLGLGRLTELSNEQWRSTLATNLDSVFYLLRAALPVMQQGGSGAVLVNGSIAAYKTFPGHPAYCASKGALNQLIKQVALDYGPKIRANVLCPGPVETPLLHNSAQAFPDPSATVEGARQATVLGRLGMPEDIAEAALFLVSDAAKWITGSALTIDGGVLCR